MLQRQGKRREDADCWLGFALEAAHDRRGINFSEECAVLPTIGALQRMVALTKNCRFPGAPQPPDREDCQDVLLPAETKQDLAQSWRAKPAQRYPTNNSDGDGERP